VAARVARDIGEAFGPLMQQAARDALTMADLSGPG
jgi:hypothetical protein